MYELYLGGQNFEFDLSSATGQKKMVELILIAYRKKFPFFINLLISLCDIKNVEEENSGSLAYTKLNINSERIDIYINFNMIEKKKISYNCVLFLIFHELLHNYLYHFLRFKQEIESGNTLLVNIVTDYYVNEICRELIGNEPADEFFYKGFRIINYNYIREIATENKVAHLLPDNITLRTAWSEKTLYDFLCKHLPDMPASGDNKTNLDDHSKSSMEDNKGSVTNSGKEIDSNAVKDIFTNRIKNVEKELISQGYTEKEMAVIERKSFLTKPDYFLNTLKLKRIVCKALESLKEKTYSTMNRRKQNKDIIFKGKKKSKGYKLVVGIDVSGSISNDDLIKFTNMLSGLNRKKQDILFDIIFWSSCDIREYQNSFKGITDIKSFIEKTAIKSSVGTDIHTFHKYLNENYKEPVEVINITDGFFYYDKTLNNNIIKYHFVLTTKISPEFTEFYRDKRFSMISILEQHKI